MLNERRFLADLDTISEKFNRHAAEGLAVFEAEAQALYPLGALPDAEAVQDAYAGHILAAFSGALIQSKTMLACHSTAMAHMRLAISLVDGQDGDRHALYTQMRETYRQTGDEIYDWSRRLAKRIADQPAHDRLAAAWRPDRRQPRNVTTYEKLRSNLLVNESVLASRTDLFARKCIEAATCHAGYVFAVAARGCPDPQAADRITSGADLVAGARKYRNAAQMRLSAMTFLFTAPGEQLH